MSTVWMKSRRIVSWPERVLSHSVRLHEEAGGEPENGSILRPRRGGGINHAGNRRTYCQRPWLRLFPPQTASGTEAAAAAAAASPLPVTPPQGV